MDTRRWAAFARAVGDRPTVVALGDHAQLSSIAVGGLWPLLAKGGPKLTEVRRTRLVWEREAWAHLQSGESAKALDLYARHGKLDICATRGDALDAAVQSWDRDGRDGLIITDASNAERHLANTAAQALRLVRRELGDPVLFTRQYRRPDLSRRVENGTTAEVIGLEPTAERVRVRTIEASPCELEITVGEESACLDLHYASHVVKSQGTTVRRAYIVAGGWQTHRESLYAACSRSREGTRLFVDRESLGSEVEKEALAEMTRRSAQSRAKLAAIERKLPRRPATRRWARPTLKHPGQAAGRPWHVRAHVLARADRGESVGLGVG